MPFCDSNDLYRHAFLIKLSITRSLYANEVVDKFEDKSDCLKNLYDPLSKRVLIVNSNYNSNKLDCLIQNLFNFLNGLFSKSYSRDIIDQIHFFTRLFSRS